jgi:hypothetical protein
VTVDASGSTYSVAGIVSYAWAFGDGQTALGSTASHMYVSSSTQNYTITLTVTGADGKTGRATKQVTVTAPGGGGTPVAGNPSAQFVMVPDKGVAPLYVLFDPKDSEAGTGRTLTNYVWSFGDGESGYSMNPNEIPHTYVTTKASQVFQAMLLVLDNENADDHITKPVQAYNFQPVAGFEIANPPGGDGTPPPASSSTPRKLLQRRAHGNTMTSSTGISGRARSPSRCGFAPSTSPMRGGRTWRGRIR